MNKKVAVIGSGFSGLASAISLADKGYEVHVFEKHEQAGGRARSFKKDGFVFDMGPSWYWMPDVFERFFNKFGKSHSDYYDLERLDPSYRVYFGQDDFVDLPASKQGLIDLFESIEPGSGKYLEKFLKEAKHKYEVGINDLVLKPGKSLLEFAHPKFLIGLFQLHVFQSIHSYIRKYFKNPKLIQLMEFPVLFLGAMPEDTPALYSLMNYADMELGTWYPKGGMHKIIEGLVSLAEEKGVQFHFNSNIDKINVNEGLSDSLTVNGEKIEIDAVIGSADYNHIEQQLLEKEYRKYDEEYWDKRKMSPSSLLFYVGVDKKIDNLLHHNLFFDESFTDHAKEIYKNPEWPKDPLFYVCCPSKTDNSVAPKGKENLFILIPLASGLNDDEEQRERYFVPVVDRIERLTGQQFKNDIVYKKSYALNDFKNDYNAFKGNAYGLANTLLQTAILKPSMHSKKVKNLLYTGQLTVPGPGVPPSLISGEVAADEMNKLLS